MNERCRGGCRGGVVEDSGVGRLEEGDVRLEAPLGAGGLVQPLLELLHSRVLPPVCLQCSTHTQQV